GDRKGRTSGTACRADGKEVAYLSYWEPDGEGATRYRAHIRDATTGKAHFELALKPGMVARSVALSPSGKWLVVVGTEGYNGPAWLQAFETATGGEVARLSFERTDGWASWPQFSRDERYLAVW